jgi:hypothetical protein
VGQNIVFVNVKPGGKESNWALKIKVIPEKIIILTFTPPDCVGVIFNL